MLASGRVFLEGVGMARRRGCAALARLVAVLVVLASVVGCGAPLRDVSVVIATGTQGGVYEGLGRGLAEVWRGQGAAATARPTAGSVDNMALLRSGQVDVAICQADVAGEASGEASAAPAGTSDRVAVRALARLHDDYVQVLVRADVPAARVGELRGRRVSIGQPGSGVEFTAQRLLAAAGLRPEDVQKFGLGLRASSEALQAGRIDAFFWSGGVPTNTIADLVAQTAAQGTPVRMLDLSDVAAALQAEHPRVYQVGTVVAARAYPGLSATVVPAAVPTLVVRNLLLTTDRLPDQTAALLTQGLVDALPQLRTRGSVAAVRQLDVRAAIETDPIPLHPGAESYYRSIADS
jgi:TRAP transporter TAXI family solute receptor